MPRATIKICVCHYTVPPWYSNIGLFTYPCLRSYTEHNKAFPVTPILKRTESFADRVKLGIMVNYFSTFVQFEEQRTRRAYEDWKRWDCEW